jgi:hypothetical protein
MGMVDGSVVEEQVLEKGLGAVGLCGVYVLRSLGYRLCVRSSFE